LAVGQLPPVLAAGEPAARRATGGRRCHETAATANALENARSAFAAGKGRFAEAGAAANGTRATVGKDVVADAASVRRVVAERSARGASFGRRRRASPR